MDTPIAIYYLKEMPLVVQVVNRRLLHGFLSRRRLPGQQEAGWPKHEKESIEVDGGEDRFASYLFVVSWFRCITSASNSLFFCASFTFPRPPMSANHCFCFVLCIVAGGAAARAPPMRGRKERWMTGTEELGNVCNSPTRTQ